MQQQFVQINQSTDVLKDERIKTYGYFSGDAGSFTGSNFITSSLTAGNKEYYYTLQNAAGVDQFSVAYGHIQGSGSSDTVGQSKAVYKSIANTVLDIDEQRIGFCFTASKYHTATHVKKDIYVVAAERARMRDEVDRRYWTLQLSGSDSLGTGSIQSFTDNSQYNAGEPTRAGLRFNIISGSQGTKHTADANVYGHFYPKMGLWIFDATKLSSSLKITGTANSILSGGADHWFNKNASKGSDNTTPVTAANARGWGVAPALTNTGTENNALRFAAALARGTQTIRGKESFLQMNYLCRAGAKHFNYTNNPSYTTGSNFNWTVETFKGDPHTYISRIGLYDSKQNLVAVGSLSTPLLKNRFTELIFKLRLTY